MKTQNKSGSLSKVPQDGLYPEIIRKNYLGSKKLLNKTAVISGGDSGIGQAVAVHFAREGADIIIIYKENDKDAKETLKLVEKEGQKCILMKGDISKKLLEINVLTDSKKTGKKLIFWLIMQEFNSRKTILKIFLTIRFPKLLMSILFR